MKKKLLVSVLLILMALAVTIVLRQEADAPTVNQQSTTQPSTQIPAEQSSPAIFDKKKYSITDPASRWVIVNKERPISSTYAPTDLNPPAHGDLLRVEAAGALQTLKAAAQRDGITLRTISAYRSYKTQQTVYDGYVAKDGQKAADTYSARPGTSEHQTGWAADIGGASCDLETCFGKTKEGLWLATHAHEYGFIVRYPEGKQAQTGYQYEPWHIRYVGTDLSQELHRTGLTMEEFFSVVPSVQPY